MADTYKALQSVNVGAGGAASVSFSNIPQTFTDLVLKVSARSTQSGAVLTNMIVLYNNSSAGQYANQTLYGDGTSVIASKVSTQTFFFMTGASATSNVFGNSELYIGNYTSNSTMKSGSVDTATENQATQSFNGMVSTIWSGTDPITSMTITPASGNFAQHSTFTLYGVFNADVSTAPATPTIGTASALGEGAFVPFTPVSNAASYVATSSPGSITSTGTTSPLYVSGLSPNTAYTFTVRSQNPFGLSGASAASNSITTATDGWENLGSAVSNGTTTTAEFTSISQSYKHLAILYSIRTSQTGGQTEEQLWMRFNTVGGTSYGWQTTYSREDLNNVVTQQQTNIDAFYRLVTPSTTTAAGTWGYGIIYIYNYSNTNMNKDVSALTGYSTPTNTSSAFNLVYMSGVFNSTNAISSVRLQGGNARTWANGSRISLYGIRG